MLEGGLTVRPTFPAHIAIMRLRERLRRFEIFDRLCSNLSTLALFTLWGKVAVAIDLVHLHVSLYHTLTRFVGDLVETLPMDKIGWRPSDLLGHDQRLQL